MNRIIYIFFALITVWGVQLGNAQHIDYKTDSGFDIGFGMGRSYQQSDVRNSVGSGFDFTFGHSIYQREESFFSLDGRFRFLGGQNRAFDDRMNLDSTHNNVEYSHYNFDLELALTLNRLRNRTGIILSGFIGAGMAYNQTSFDYYDNFGTGINNNLYDYSIIDPFEMSGRRQIYQDLKLLSDGEFETKGIDHICFTPTFGLYFGYQFGKRFSMGILHKTNLFLGEDNDIIGANIDGNIPVNSPLDLNHYTSLLFKWDIRRRHSDPIEPPCNRPSVYFRVNAVDLTYASHEISGTITNVYNRADITVTVDGKQDYGFNFLPSTNKITSGFKLSPGTHTIIVAAINECGQDTEIQKVIIDAPCDRPIVNFNVNEVSLSYATHELTGTVLNTYNKSDISLKINGRTISNFRFNPTTKRVSASFELTSGTHNIVVSAINDCGENSKNFRVVVGSPCDLPIVNFNVNEVNLSYATHELSGTVRNAYNKSDINIKINGRSVYDFRFNPSTKRISASLKLTSGSHNIVVSANSDCGQDTESRRVNVNAPCNAPVVKVRVNRVNLSYATHELIGTIENVSNKTDIKVTVDGKHYTGFSFIQHTKTLNTTLKLSPGTHSIVVTATNECGQDSEIQRVVIDAPCDLPFVNFNVNKVSLSYASHQLSGTITNAFKKSDISIKINGRTISDFRFNPSTKRISANLNLNSGTHNITVTAINDCGQDSETKRVVVNRPCEQPVVNFNINKINHTNASHKLTGTVTNIKNKSNITIKLDGRTFNSFQYVPSTKRISANLNLSPGTHTVIVTAINECGQDSETESIVVYTPCSPPTVNFNVNETSSGSVSHKLSGTVTNVKNKSDISIKLDGRTFNSFQYVPSTKRISANFNLSPGTHTIIVTAINECGQDSETESVIVSAPCSPPVVNFNVNEINSNSASHGLSGTVSNIRTKSDITVKLDGRTFNSFQYVPSTKRISANFNLSPGTHTVIVTATNECGQDSETESIVVSVPCSPPIVNFNVNEISSSSASHELAGTVTNVKTKSDITVKLDGRTFSSFQYVPSTKKISANFNLSPGTHTIIVTAINECGQDSESKRITVEEKDCGTRINPGNSDWEFCLITPRGTYNRTNLSNSSFSYSGSASSLFFKAIAGGSNATVNGMPYSISSGKYYLFTGNITVTVSSKNPGSMGHWSVCINADKAPQSGVGNSRPKSPCESTGSKGKGNSSGVRFGN